MMKHLLHNIERLPHDIFSRLRMSLAGCDVIQLGKFLTIHLVFFPVHNQ